MTRLTRKSVPPVPAASAVLEPLAGGADDGALAQEVLGEVSEWASRLGSSESRSGLNIDGSSFSFTPHRYRSERTKALHAALRSAVTRAHVSYTRTTRLIRVSSSFLWELVASRYP